MSVSINYQLNLQLVFKLVQPCVAFQQVFVLERMYDSIPNSYIEIEAWYQKRSVRTCSRQRVRKSHSMFIELDLVVVSVLISYY